MVKTDLLQKLRNGLPITTREQILLTLQLSWPAIVAQLASIMMQLIDAAMVGQLGSNQSAAIGLVASTTWLFNELCIAVSTGFRVLVAQKIGAGEEKDARNLMKMGLLISLAFSTVVMALGLSISGALPRWLGAEETIWKDAATYFFVFALFLPVTETIHVAAGQLRASGNMRVPSLWMMLMCLLDVVFNAILIFPTGTYHIGAWAIPGFDLGVLGAALGTALAHLVAAVALLAYLLLRSPELRLRREEPFLFRGDQLRQSLRISAPVVAESVTLASARVMTTAIVAPLGTVAIAANSFGITAESICYMPAYGVYHAASTLVGQSIGAKRKETYRLGWLAVLLGMGMLCVTGALLYVLSPLMMQFLSKDPEVIALGIQVLRIEAFAEPLYGAMIVCGGVFQGAGKTLASTVLNFTTMWGVRVPLSALLAPWYGLQGVWFAMAFQLSLCGLLYLMRLWSKRWLPRD